MYRLPTILNFEKVDYILLLDYYKHKYNKILKPVQRRNGKSIKCPKCGAPHVYIYDNNVNKGQFQCKVCCLTFKGTNNSTKRIVFKYPYFGNTLISQKEGKYFIIHKCKHSKHSYYLQNLKMISKDLDHKDKNKYKLHYIYRQFKINFFKIHLHTS